MSPAPHPGKLQAKEDAPQPREKLLHEVSFNELFPDLFHTSAEGRMVGNCLEKIVNPSQGTSWFKKQYSDGGTGRYRNANKGSSHQYRNDFDVETSFRSAFGGNRFFYWSFINEENPQWRRLALGLSVSGPLKLEDVKNAYRPCALKWHPDRHQGSSKAVAEEKFELCSAAYQSLCDSLALD
ncbi:hypothetical protein JHK86_007491 [Glycine max]|nr:hypothetical protein JHK86_007491 [Glycine max]